jgi:xanthine dehydrogenase accessory factor
MVSVEGARVNHWLESAEVLSRAEELAAAGASAALATVVRVVGSAYRRPGAKLLVVPGGGGLGGVSGGCLEGDVRDVGGRVLASGEPRLLHYDTTAGDEEPWALGLGCRGQVDVFVQPATAGPLRAAIAGWRDRLAGEQPFAVATVVAGADALGTTWIVDATDAGADKPAAVAPPASSATSPAVPVLPFAADATSGLAAELAPAIGERAAAQIARGRPGCEEVGGHLVFFEVLLPPPRLLVCGAGDDAVPVVERAAETGFRVTVLDHRGGLLRPERFPAGTALVLARPEDGDLPPAPAAQSLAVVMTHSFATDREWARRLLAAGLPYVGLLGPRARTLEIRRAIGAESDPRLCGPVGLDLGADGPRQVAISIVAQLLAVVSGRTPRHLAERTEAIHVV